MKTILFNILLTSLILVITATACDKNDECTTLSNKSGTVIPAGMCRRFKSLSRDEQSPCGFDGLTPLICCPSVVSMPRMLLRKVIEMCNSFGKRPEEKYNEAGLRVIGGRLSEIGEFPHFAALGYRNNETSIITFDCGGALIKGK